MNSRSNGILRGGLGRRDLLKLMGYSGLGVTVFGSSAMQAELAAAQANETPQRGGILKVNLTSDPSNFDPMSTTTNRVLYIAGACYNGMIQFDPMKPDEIIGDLASSWAVSDDGLVYTFSLVRNVTFHDGKPCTSADVKYTLDFVRKPPEKAVSVRKAQLAVIDTIEAPDAATVKIVLKRPSPAFLPILANGWMLIYPKHILEAKGSMKDDVVGTGPFKLDKYTKGVSIDLVRNDNYHVQDRPFLDGISVFIVDDPTSTLSYLETGQLSLYMNMGDDEARRAKSSKNVVVQEVPALSFNCISFNTTKGPFADVRVRQAVSLAVNRDEAIKVVGQGQAVLGGLMPPGRWSLPPEKLAEIPGYGGENSENLAKAKALMVEAGHPDGFTTVLTTKRNKNYEALSIFVQAKIAEIGIKSTVDLQEDAVSNDTLMAKNYEISPWVHTAAGDDPDAIFSDFYTCDASRNFSGVCDKDFDKSYEAQSQEMDEAKRLAISQEMEVAMLEEFNRAILFWQKKFLGLSPNVRNLIIHPVMDNNRRFQDVWLASS